MLDSAKDLNDLRVPPGNRLEKLGGDRRGQYSVRINDQWRICFRWRDDGAWDVEIVDYHSGRYMTRNRMGRSIPAKSCVKSFWSHWKCRLTRCRRRFASRRHE